MPYKIFITSLVSLTVGLQSVHAADLAYRVQTHPDVEAAKHAFCATSYGVKVQKASRLPSVDFRLSANDKPVNETTRGDAFGGENSPEYDGEGIDAELSVTQSIYDWGKSGADIGIAKARNMKERLVYLASYEQNTLQLLSALLLHQSQDAAIAAIQRNVNRVQGNRKAVATQVRLGYTAKRALNEYDLLLLDRESMLAEAKFKQQETERRLASEYGIEASRIARLSKQLAKYLPKAMLAVPPENALNTRQMDEEIRIYDLQNRRVKAQGRPKVEARMAARNWDITESDLCTDIAPVKTDCRTNDVIGSLEVNMPFYTGGAQQNQRRALLAKKSEMQARRTTLVKKNMQENENALQRLEILSNRLLAEQEKVDLLTSQLKIERQRQKSNAIRFSVIAELDSALADSKVAVASLEYELQIAHARQLVRGGKLSETLEINSKLPSCNG